MHKMLPLLILSLLFAGCIPSENEVLPASESVLLKGVESGVYFSFMEGEKGEELMLEQSAQANEYSMQGEDREGGTTLRFIPLGSETYLVQMLDGDRVDLFVVHSMGDGIIAAIPWDADKCFGVLEDNGVAVSDSTVIDRDLERIRKGMLAWSDAAKGDPVGIFYLPDSLYGDMTDEEIRELLQDRQAWPGNL